MIEEGYEVKVVKLVSGEELLGCVKEESAFQITLKHPFSLVMTPDGKIASIPFMIYADLSEGMQIRMTHVLSIVTPRQDLIDSYERSISAILTQNKRIVV